VAYIRDYAHVRISQRSTGSPSLSAYWLVRQKLNRVSSVQIRCSVRAFTVFVADCRHFRTYVKRHTVPGFPAVYDGVLCSFEAFTQEEDQYQSTDNGGCVPA